MNIKTILVPMDFSLPSQRALEIATSLAAEQQAKLVILHVLEPIPFAGEGQLAYSFEDMGTDEARRQLQKVLPSDRSILFEHKLVRGDAATQILNVAQEIAADLIIMGTHGRTWLTHLLLGSVAETVVRNANCPVLTAKQPAPVASSSTSVPIPSSAASR